MPEAIATIASSSAHGADSWILRRDIVPGNGRGSSERTRVPVSMELTPDDRAALEGDRGEAVHLAMRILVEIAAIGDAPRLIDVTSAHVDGCLYHGQAGRDFAERPVA